MEHVLHRAEVGGDVLLHYLHLLLGVALRGADGFAVFQEDQAGTVGGAVLPHPHLEGEVLPAGQAVD